MVFISEQYGTAHISLSHTKQCVSACSCESPGFPWKVCIASPPRSYVHEANVFVARHPGNGDGRKLVLVAVLLATAVAQIEVRTLLTMPTSAGCDFAHAAIAAMAVFGDIRVEAVIERHHGAVGGAPKLR